MEVLSEVTFENDVIWRLDREQGRYPRIDLKEM